MQITIGKNIPTYEKRWGIRVFKPFKGYGFHIHLGPLAIGVNPFGIYAPRHKGKFIIFE
jgi:hypothetical protein